MKIQKGRPTTTPFNSLMLSSNLWLLWSLHTIRSVLVFLFLLLLFFFSISVLYDYECNCKRYFSLNAVVMVSDLYIYIFVSTVQLHPDDEYKKRMAIRAFVCILNKAAQMGCWTDYGARCAYKMWTHCRSWWWYSIWNCLEENRAPNSTVSWHFIDSIAIKFSFNRK